MAASFLRFLSAALLIAAALATTPAASRAAALSADDLADVERALGYLNSISTLRDAGNPDIGKTTQVFADKPLALRKWQVVDAQGCHVTLQVI